jgi:mannose-1-phosphate guanylyltransferase
MAGGGGTRLWPLSQPERPKQLLPLLGGRSLFALSVERLLSFLPAGNVFVVTGAGLRDALHKTAPQLPPENFLVEPSPRNTAPAIAFALGMLRRRAPRFTMACLPADHFIANQREFQAVFSAATAAAERGYLVTLGIAPTGPNTGYGYIEEGKRMEDASGRPLFAVKRFTEKPNVEDARQLISQGGHAWNSGMFFWRSDVVEAEYRRQQPAMAKGFERLTAETSLPSEDPLLGALWTQMPALSVDYAIMEKAAKVAVLPAGELGWTDIGDWDALLALYEAHPHLRPVSADTRYDSGSRGLAVFREGVAGRVLATVGLDDVIIVETEDTVLVCKRGKSQDVRGIVEQLKKRSANNQ